MIPAKILNLDIGPGRRVLVTSDIHGHGKYLKKLLEQAEFSQKDFLIIVGDIIEKGPESLSTLRYVMELTKNGNVFPLTGNVDLWRYLAITGLNGENAQEFYDGLVSYRGWVGTSLFDEMTRELGFLCESPQEVLSAKEKVLEHFAPEMEFLAGLPAIIETQNYTFVHGGLRDKSVAENAKRDVFELAKYDHFLTSTPYCFEKPVVVGHWPVALYREDVPSVNPLFDLEKKIVSIDGGCGLKEFGQLNLLIIPDSNSPVESVSCIHYDEIPVYRALDLQPEVPGTVNVRWIDREIQVLEKGDGVTRVRHVSTGRELWFPSSYIDESGQCREDCTDHIPAVEPGDKLSLLTATPKGCLVKKDGVVGWYYGRLEGLEK